MPKETISDQHSIAERGVEIVWGRDSGNVAIGSVDFTKEPYTVERGWFIDLNRDGINAMIRVLRRARDQAYGVDE